MKVGINFDVFILASRSPFSFLRAAIIFQASVANLSCKTAKNGNERKLMIGSFIIITAVNMKGRRS